MDWLKVNLDFTINIAGVIISLLTLIILPLIFKDKDNVIINIIFAFLGIFSKKIEGIEYFDNTLKGLKKDIFKFFGIKPTDTSLNQKDGESADRDVNLDAWTRLKDIIEEGNRVYSNQSSTANNAQQKIYLLCSNSIITQDQADVIIHLYNLGKKLNDNPKWTPRKNPYYYKHTTDEIIIWLKRQLKTKPSQKKKPLRKTTVDSFYHDSSTPSNILPSTVLTGIKGNVQGKKFKIEKELFYIGANAENDIAISDDDFVSGKHALLQTHAGTLSLADQQSRNGTFLNGQRLTDKPLSVNIGDKIQIGKSTFEITAK